MVHYNTEIEPISPRLEFNQPYDARCQVSPAPRSPVEYTWYFRDRVVGKGESLHINRFDRFASGEYICAARSAGRFGEASRQYANATIGLRLKASTEDHTGMKLTY